MAIKIQKNKKYRVPQTRIKEIEKIYQEELTERERIDKMTWKEYNAYMIAELKEADEEIERGKFYTHEEVMKEIEEEIKADERERKNYEKWMRLIKKEKAHVI